MAVSSVRLGSSCQGQVSTRGPHGRKRKRVIDEDADSAAGNSQEEDEQQDQGDVDTKPVPSTLDSLNKDMKEVYHLLQQGTARGKLIAEQVGRYMHSLSSRPTRCFPSFALPMAPSNPSVHISRRTNVLDHGNPNQ